MKSILLLLFSCACFSVHAQQVRYNSLTPMYWLQGSWSGVYNNAPFYEAWRSAGDSVLINFSIEVKGADTVVKENSAIRLMSDGSIRMFGSAKEVWIVTSVTADAMTFENDTLKYANTIIWSRGKNDHWLTLIRNPGGKLDYDMTRISWPETAVNRYIKKAEAGKN